MQSRMLPTVQEEVSQKLSNPFKKDWKPVWRKVEGQVFVKLNKWDQDCFKFMVGEALKTTAKGFPQNHYFPFWELMVKTRNDSSQTAFEKVLEDARAEEEPPKKRQRARRAKMSDSALAGDVVKCKLDFGPSTIEADMLFGTRGADLYVVADPYVLQFIQRALHHDFINEHPRPEPKPRYSKGQTAKGDDKKDDEHDDDNDAEPDDVVVPEGNENDAAGAAFGFFPGFPSPPTSGSHTACGHKDTPKD